MLHALAAVSHVPHDSALLHWHGLVAYKPHHFLCFSYPAPHQPRHLLSSSRAVLLTNTSAALSAAARLLPAMRLQPSEHAINVCGEATQMKAALRDSNRRTFDALLRGDAAELSGLRVLLLSDSTDYNALAYAGDVFDMCLTCV